MTENKQKPPAILVVEDETLLRVHTVCLLEAAGYKVMEAKNADEILQMVAYMLLDGAVDAKMLGDLRVDLVPRTANLSRKKTAQNSR